MNNQPNVWRNTFQELRGIYALALHLQLKYFKKILAIYTIYLYEYPIPDFIMVAMVHQGEEGSPMSLREISEQTWKHYKSIWGTRSSSSSVAAYEGLLIRHRASVSATSQATYDTLFKNKNILEALESGTKDINQHFRLTALTNISIWILGAVYLLIFLKIFEYAPSSIFPVLFVAFILTLWLVLLPFYTLLGYSFWLAKAGPQK